MILFRFLLITVLILNNILVYRYYKYLLEKNISDIAPRIIVLVLVANFPPLYILIITFIPPGGWGLNIKLQYYGVKLYLMIRLKDFVIKLL